MKNEELKIFPNPTNGQLKIKSEKLKEGDVIEIYSIVGQLVGAYPCGRPETCGHPETTIDVSHLTNGMYFLKVGNKMAKFVRE